MDEHNCFEMCAPDYDPAASVNSVSGIARDDLSGKLMDTLAVRLHDDIRATCDRIGDAVNITGRKNYENPERRAVFDTATKPLFNHYERGHQGPANRLMMDLEGTKLIRTGQFAPQRGDTDNER